MSVTTIPRALTLNPDPKTVRRASEGDRELTAEYVRADGSRYAVPLWRPMPGVSADAAARALRGRIPARGERRELEERGEVLGALSDGGLTYPLVSR
jgi:hypothetical protein